MAANGTPIAIDRISPLFSFFGFATGGGVCFKGSFLSCCDFVFGTGSFFASGFGTADSFFSSFLTGDFSSFCFNSSSFLTGSFAGVVLSVSGLLCVSLLSRSFFSAVGSLVFSSSGSFPLIVFVSGVNWTFPCLSIINSPNPFIG